MCVKKFIFRKFAGLQAYSLQLYYQMNSFTGIFRQHFKPSSPMLAPCIDLSPPHQSPPRVLSTRGKPWYIFRCENNKFSNQHRLRSKHIPGRKMASIFYFSVSFTNFSPVSDSIQKSIIWFAVQIKWLVFIWNAPLNWNGVTIKH